MRLSDPLIDMIWSELAVTYQRRFIAQFDGLDVAAVKLKWADELGQFAQSTDAIRFALRNLPTDWPPTVLAFKALCNRAPTYLPRALPRPLMSEEERHRVHAALTALRARLVSRRRDEIG